MDAEEGPVLQVEGAAGQLGQLVRDASASRDAASSMKSHSLLPGLRCPPRRRARRTGASSTAGNVLRSASCRARTRRKRPPEGVEIELGADPSGAGDVIGGPGRRELVSIPEHLLTVRGPRLGRLPAESGRSGRDAEDVTPSRRRRRCSLAPLGHARGSTTPSIRTEKRELHAEVGVDLGLQLHGGQRVEPHRQQRPIEVDLYREPVRGVRPCGRAGIRRCRPAESPHSEPVLPFAATRSPLA